MDGTTVKAVGWLGETWGFWIQTGALFASVVAAIWLIIHNGKQARMRALIDLIIQQKSNKDLYEAIQLVYRLAENGKPLSSMVENDTEERRKILVVLNNQEFIATGIRMGAFDGKLYKQMQCSNVVKLWNAASGFVHELRKIDNKNTIFQDFERLAQKWEKTPIKKIG